LSQIERELVAQVGKPSFTQKLLIRRLSRAMLRLEPLDEKHTAGTLSDHDSKGNDRIRPQRSSIRRDYR
jgi:hypothetical protein